MLAHCTFGTSMADSRRVDGLVTARAEATWRGWMTRLSMMACGRRSASRSISGIFSRTHIMADSNTTCDRSAPQYPCVSAASACRSTSPLSLKSRALMRRISSRPASSGTGMLISRSKRPKRRRPGSMAFGRLVAAMSTTRELGLRLSIRVMSCETSRFSASPCVLSLRGAMASSSSMKIIDGAFFSASSNASRRFCSDSPLFLDMTCGPLIR
mmetsp:Transcript_2382/g.7980  ORF Transcript_2382/g.7980 Transcript_2382/m.7980 type:complete len:213 (-) Transcript_2382:1071-1709(-)